MKTNNLKTRFTPINVLLVIALLITIAGTILNLSNLDHSKIPFSQITGAATNVSTGTATLTVSSQTEVTLRVASIAFGSGYVNTSTASCTYCTTSTDIGHNAGNASCCSRFNNVTAGFLIENTGNENVTLNFTCSGNCTAAAFINGTSPSFQFRLANSSDGGSTGKVSNNSGDLVTDTASSCSSGAGGWNYSSWTDVAASGFDLCGSNGTTEYYFSSESSKDAVIMDIKIKIPDDARTGSAKTATFDFKAQSQG